LPVAAVNGDLTEISSHMDASSMTPVQPPRARRRGARTPDDRFATWLRRLRWPVVIAWILAIAALYGLSGSLSKVTNDEASAYLPASAASTRVVLLQQAAAQAASRAGGQPQTNAAIAVFASSGPLTAADQAAIRSARTAVAGLAGHVAGLAAPSALHPSADGKAVAFSVNITGPVAAVQAIRAAIAKPAAAAGAGLVAAVTGPAAVEADTSSGHQQTTLLLTALIIVAVILLLVYLSPILWLLPLFSAIAAIVIAQASAHGLANAGLTVSRLSADILIVLVFGAASDYALLLMHRYREELRHHAMTEAAMATALRATLPTLVASAGTVTCAMLCLLAADSASLHGLGPVGAVGIVSALLAQTTFLPRCCS
jgi:RND superfamily putative drug exporter